MENITSTENTKEIDEYFKIDESKYKKLQMRRLRTVTTWKAVCNECGSFNTTVYPSIQEVPNK